MPQQLLDQLDELKNRFGLREAKKVQSIVGRLRQRKSTDAQELIHYHEILLFLRAYPHTENILLLVERELQNFATRIVALRDSGADLSALEPPDVSGLAGLAVADTFSFFIVRWLARRQPNRLSFDWQDFEDENRLAQTWPRFMPLLEDDSSVEANVPYRTWLRYARGSERRAVRWLIQQFDELKISDNQKAELFDAQKLYVTWRVPQRESRTELRLPVRRVFYHREPLLQRREISLQRELENRSPKLQKLNPKQGEAMLDLARAASTVRYRELYGFTHGDSRQVLKADLGRGVDVFIMGLPPAMRLPLRAYHAAMIFKNGVPIGYFEGLSIFERMESGFNLYYTFRDGETAWLYARLLNIFRHLLGVTAFTIDPYQVGFENEEGIESGAFWFYRKLGFRSTNPETMKLVLNEEKKIASRDGYRTSARILRNLAKSPMIFELDQSRAGDWDRFETRNIGLAAQRIMAAKHDGHSEKFQLESVKQLARATGIKTADWPEAATTALSNFAVALSAEKSVAQWSAGEKTALANIIRAKATADESRYLKLMQRHTRLRRTLIRLGSR